ncbi:hypothetical protein SLEP1_g39913 [Rubroshorea leprosula]|uniref:Uncharacterized protein n=1 Tax=Rubroshorea leprosula TaxID=152421 RepID=A0AAV5L1V4_9ROSI|nr:hypothetical protein SLEP1_g39913 [Rubroshorea leprosula]
MASTLSSNNSSSPDGFDNSSVFNNTSSIRKGKDESEGRRVRCETKKGRRAAMELWRESRDLGFEIRRGRLLRPVTFHIFDTISAGSAACQPLLQLLSADYPLECGVESCKPSGRLEDWIVEEVVLHCDRNTGCTMVIFFHAACLAVEVRSSYFNI